jgi:MarR family transcriptional regulator, organic hydroperoxide resistance regulator
MGRPSPDNDISPLIIRLCRGHRYLARQLFETLDLHPGQEGLLQQLWQQDQRTQVELAKSLEVEPPTVSRMIDALDRRGLVTRRPAPGDRRAVVIELTQSGRELQADFENIWLELGQRTVASLSATDQKELCRLLQEITKNLVQTCAEC